MIEPQREEDSAQNKIRNLVNSQLGWVSSNPFGSIPFDISKPNFHDNKSDFLRERDTIRGIVNHLGEIQKLTAFSKINPDPQNLQTTARLEEIIEDHAHTEFAGKFLRETHQV